MIRRTIEVLAEAERNVALKQRLSPPKCRIISRHNTRDLPMVGSFMSTDNSREIERPPDRPQREPRSDLSDLLQRLSVLTAIQDRCDAMAAEISEEHVSEEIKGTASGELRPHIDV